MFFRNQSRKRLLAWMAAALILLGFSQTWSLLRNAGTGGAAEVIAAVPENHDVLITGTVIRQEQVIECDANISWSCRKDIGTRVAPGEILFQENSPDLQQWAQNEIVEAQAAQVFAPHIFLQHHQLRHEPAKAGGGQIRVLRPCFSRPVSWVMQSRMASVCRGQRRWMSS